MSSSRRTEKDSPDRDIHSMSTAEILRGINREDQQVAPAVQQALPQIEAAVEAIYSRMSSGGRLFYIGAGTSGRLGILDASELPPTFGADPGWVTGLIAGGDGAIRKAVERAEDDPDGAWRDLQPFAVSAQDLVLGIAASGTTPYVVGGLAHCRKRGIATACIVCNENSPLEQQADYPIVIDTGPEFITGSTRMKAGSAQKMTLNMISTAVMVKLGRVEGNKMVDMQLNNAKLRERGRQMVAAATGLSLDEAEQWLLQHGSVRKAIAAWNAGDRLG